MRISTEKEKFQYLGAPGTISNLTTVKVPMVLKLSWKLGYSIKSFTCHKLFAPHIERIFTDLNKLDPTVIRASGMDIWGGCYNLRAVRGTESRDRPPFSTHAWGAAIDMDPDRNGLYTKAPRANLSKVEFQPVMLIWAKYGFVNLGHVIGRDFMHFESSYEMMVDPAKYLV